MVVPVFVHRYSVAMVKNLAYPVGTVVSLDVHVFMVHACSVVPVFVDEVHFFGDGWVCGDWSWWC